MFYFISRVLNRQNKVNAEKYFNIYFVLFYLCSWLGPELSNASVLSSSQNGTNSLVVSVSRVPVFLFLAQLAFITLCVFLFFCRFTVSTANNSLTRSLLSSRVHRRSRDDATSDWCWLRQPQVRRANFALNWTRENGKWSRGRPQKTLRLTFGEDLQVICRGEEQSRQTDGGISSPDVLTRTGRPWV